MTLYLQTNDFHKFQQVPIHTIDDWLLEEYGLNIYEGGGSPPEETTDGEKAHDAATVIFGFLNML
jgi:hypothetical protein